MLDKIKIIVKNITKKCFFLKSFLNLKLKFHVANLFFIPIGRHNDEKPTDVFWAVLAPGIDNPQYTTITGQRGKPKIVYDGFTYICAKVSNERRYVSE